jgi:predicted permease
MWAEIFAIVAPVYICAGVGFLWVRLGRAFDTTLLTDLIMGVGAPCLVFSSLVSYEIESSQVWQMFLATLVATGLMAGAAAVLLRVAGLPRHTFLAPMTFGNTGNMGIPLCFFAFGEAGLALGVCFFAVTTVLHFTLGQAIWSDRVASGALLRTPLVWAALAAVIVILADLEVPIWLSRTTSLLGSFTIPIMQLTLGVSLAQLRVTRLLPSLGLALLRLSIGLGVGLAVASLFGFSGVAAGVVILDCAMPVAVFNYMFAVRYERSPVDVAGLIVVSTLLSLMVIPLLVSWLLPGTA